MLFYASGRGFALPFDPSPEHGAAMRQTIHGVCGFRADDAVPDPRAAPLAPMGYFFDHLPLLPEMSEDAIARMAGVIASGVTERTIGKGVRQLHLDLAKLLTNDICATAFRAVPADQAQTDARMQRPFLEASLGNLRRGGPWLDSVYGGALMTGPVARSLRRALIDPEDPARLRIACRDGEADMPRLGDVLPDDAATLADLKRMPPDVAAHFLNPANEPRLAAPLAADLRNVDDRGMQRLTLALMTEHNRVVAEHPATQDRQAVFQAARMQTEALCRRLWVNHLLPSVAEPKAIANARANRATVYDAFVAELSPSATRTAPVAMEVVFAVLPMLRLLRRRLHQKLRAQDVLMRHVGDPSDPTGLAAFRESGDDALARSIPGFFGGDAPAGPQGADAPHEPADGASSRALIQGYARHWIVLGQQMNLPGAEECINALQTFDIHLKPADYINELRRLGIPGLTLNDTPLFLYLWIESQHTSGGARLGPLGSRLLSEHIIGQCLRVEGDAILSDERSAQTDRFLSRLNAR